MKKTVVFSVKIDPNFHATIKDAARENGQTAGAFVRQAVYLALAAKESRQTAVNGGQGVQHGR